MSDANEAINDSSKLVAQALALLKEVQCEDCNQAAQLGNAQLLLEQALDKLTSNIGQ